MQYQIVQSLVVKDIQLINNLLFYQDQTQGEQKKSYKLKLKDKIKHLKLNKLQKLMLIFLF